ncbi:hypothetical protein [Salicibibacter kimchii]|nr:hypothetical protein [Salicibibacter kimchii]
MKKAQEQWNQIPEWTREKIAHNVFCVSCDGTTTIADYKIRWRDSEMIFHSVKIVRSVAMKWLVTSRENESLVFAEIP